MAKNTRPRILLVNRCLIRNEEGRYLIIKRAERDVWEAGKWELPGGKLDLGQDPLNALEREVLEETGLVVNTVQHKVFTESYILNSGKYKGLPYIILIYEGKLVGGTIKLSDEHSEHKWIDKKEVFEYDFTTESKKGFIALTS